MTRLKGVPSATPLTPTPLGSGSNFVLILQIPPSNKKAHERIMDLLRENGAGERIRTVDIDLGKVALYH